MFDVKQIANSYLGYEPALYVKDSAWVEFGGLKPADKNKQALAEYNAMLTHANSLLNAGNLADWTAFVEEFASIPLVVAIITARKTVTGGFRDELQDLMLVLSFDTLRSSQIIQPFWENAKAIFEQGKPISLEVTEAMKLDWNNRVAKHYLPSYMLLN